MPNLNFKRSRSKENLKLRSKSTDSTPAATTTNTPQHQPPKLPDATIRPETGAPAVKQGVEEEDEEGKSSVPGRTSPSSPTKSKSPKSSSKLFGAFRRSQRKDGAEAGFKVVSRPSGSPGDSLLESSSAASTDPAALKETPATHSEQPTSSDSSAQVVSTSEAPSSPRMKDVAIPDSKPASQSKPTSSFPSPVSSKSKSEFTPKSFTKSTKSSTVPTPVESSSNDSLSTSRPPLPHPTSGFSLRSFRKATTHESEAASSKGAEASPSLRSQSRRTSSLDEFATSPENLAPGDSSTPATPTTSSISAAKFRAAARTRMASESAEGVGSTRSRRASTLEPFLDEETRPDGNEASGDNRIVPAASYSPVPPGLTSARSRAEELAQLEAQLKSSPRTLSRMKSEDSVSSLNAMSGSSTLNNRVEPVTERSMSSTSVPKLSHSSSLSGPANLPNESALSIEDGPPPLPGKGEDKDIPGSNDSYFPPVSAPRSPSASFSGTSLASSPTAGRSRTNTAASQSRRGGLLLKKGSSSSLGYQGHLAAVRAAAEASAASYDRIHGTETPADAFKETCSKKADVPIINQGSESPRASRGRGTDSARILASFDQKSGPPQTLLDALARLEKERAPRTPGLLPQTQTKVWGADSEQVRVEFSPPRLPWMSGSGSRSPGRRVASESSVSGEAWKSKDPLPDRSFADDSERRQFQELEIGSGSKDVVASPTTQEAEPGANDALCSSPRAPRIPLSARLAQAVGSRPTSPGTSRPSSPDHERVANRNSHRRSYSASIPASETEHLNRIYAAQLSNLSGVSDFGLPMAPGVVDDDSETQALQADLIPQDASSNTEKRSSTPSSESNNLRTGSFSDGKAEMNWIDGNRALGPYPTITSSVQSPSRRFSHLMS